MPNTVTRPGERVLIEYAPPGWPRLAVVLSADGREVRLVDFSSPYHLHRGLVVASGELP